MAAITEGGMLLLSRKRGETVVIQHPDGDIVVTVLEMRRGQVRLGLGAKRSIPIWRSEMLPLRPRGPGGDDGPKAA